MKQYMRLGLLLFVLGFVMAAGLSYVLAQDSPEDAENRTQIHEEQEPSFWDRLFGGQSEAARVLATPNPLGEIAIGDEAAPITMVEYSSLSCPHCAAFHATKLPQLKKDYVAAGHLRILFRPFPFDPPGTAGAMLAQCVPPAQRAGFLDILFVRQNDWVVAQEPMKKLQTYAQAIGMSQDDVLACWKDENVLAEIRRMQQDAYEILNVTSTPTFFINGDKHEGNLSYQQFEQIFARYLPSDIRMGDAQDTDPTQLAEDTNTNTAANSAHRFIAGIPIARRPTVRP